MLLIINNTEKEKNIFYLLMDNKFVQRGYSQNSGILECLEKLLWSVNLQLKDLDCLGVVVGEGRFTASRLAVTAVNALAYSLKIPVIALPKDFDQALAVRLAKSAIVGQYVVPAYSGEANVGSQFSVRSSLA